MEQQHNPKAQELHDNPVVTLLTPASIEALRSNQKEVYYRHYNPENGINDEDALDQEMRALVDDHLESAGVREDDPNFAVLRRYLDDWSYDNMSDSEWDYGAWENPEAALEDRTLLPDSSGRDRIERAWQILLDEPLDGSGQANGPDQAQDNNEIDGDEADPRGELNDEVLAEAYLENGRFDVGKSREAWATVSAKRQGRAFSLKDKNRDAIRDKYHEDVQKLGVMELKDQISDSDSDTEKNAMVITWLFEEQARLRELTTEKLQGTPVGRFVNFMNKGSRKARFMKAMGLGVAAGVGGAFLAGAAGAAAVAIGAAGASRFAKGYARGDNHRGMQTARESFIDENGENLVYLETSDGLSITDKFTAAASEYNKDFEHDTVREQQKRRKALMIGFGSVALGGVAAWGIHEGAEWVAGRSLTAYDAISDGWFDGSSDTGNGSIERSQDATLDADSDGIDDAVDDTVDVDGDGIDDRTDQPVPGAEDITDEFNPENVSYDARWVETNEGWYQTFQELGIPEDRWGEVLNDAGPKLQEQGWAYFDTDANEYRISRPGELSDDALRTIAASSKRANFTLAA